MAIDGPEVVEVDAQGNVIDIEEAKEKKGRGKVADEPEKPAYSDELLARCKELGIGYKEIDEGGGFRQNRKKKIYFIPLEELVLFEQADSDIEDNDEFWDWFDEFISLHEFQTKAQKTKKKQRSWQDWAPNYDYGSWKNKASNWWNDYGGYSSYSGDSALTKKLAVALKAVNTTVQVVNDTTKRFHVKLASDDDPTSPKSYTDFNSLEVVVSPQALLDTSIDMDYGIAVTTGFGLHEASHVKYTESLKDSVLKPSKLTPMAISSLLMNILEDVRIEELTAEKFPGFREYFVHSGEYMWNTSKDSRSKEWGPELEDKLNSVIAFVKWPNEYKEICDADPALAAEWAWWGEWRDSYTSGKETLRMATIRGLEHLKEDPQTRDQCDQMEKRENEAADQIAQTPITMSDDQFKKFLDSLRRELLPGVGDPCPSPSMPGVGPNGGGVEIKLTPEQGKELDRLMREQFTQEETHFTMWEGGPILDGPRIQVTRPTEDWNSKNAYEKPGPMADRLRSVFFFRKRAHTEKERLLKQGFVDEDELWRAGAGDLRVFERTTQIEESPTSVTLLVDISGSMAGSGCEMAQMLANVMNACLRTQRGVRVRIRAHSTVRGEGSGHDSAIYRIWEQGDPDTRLGLISTLPHGSNFDGFAIEWCLKELNDTALPGEQQVLIVLSDGLPAGRTPTLSYSGDSAMKHVRQVTDKAQRTNDAFTIQIAIEPEGLNEEQQATMFKHWIPYTTDQGLLRDMTKLLARIFGAVE